jgi:hypothetical protein
MNISSGMVIYQKFNKKPAPKCEASTSGKRAVTKIIKTIIMLNTIIRYLNFNDITPIIRIIKETLCYVNLIICCTSIRTAAYGDAQGNACGYARGYAQGNACGYARGYAQGYAQGDAYGASSNVEKWYE